MQACPVELEHDMEERDYARLDRVQAPEFARAIRRAISAGNVVIANAHTNQAFRVADVLATTPIGGNDLHLYHAENELGTDTQVAYKTDGPIVDGCRYHTQAWFDLLAQVSDYLD
jgi:hypothetical protein